MTSAKPTYNMVVTEETNDAPGCKHVSQAQDEVPKKENLPPARLITSWMHEYFQASHRTTCTLHQGFTR